MQQLQEHAKDLLAFGGIGAGAQLVQNDERSTLRVLEERADARELHTQPAFFLVGVRSLAKRHEHAADKTDRGVLRGDESSGLSEQLTQPERLQKARLAAGVWAGGDAGVDEARQVQICGDGCAALALPEQQRVPKSMHMLRVRLRRTCRDAGQAHVQALGLGQALEVQRSQVEFEVTFELQQRRHVLAHAVPNCLQPTIYDLVGAERVALYKREQATPEAHDWMHVEAGVAPLAQRHDRQCADAPVCAQADLEVGACTVGFEVEQRGQLRVTFTCAHALAEREQACERGARALKCRVERVHRIAHRAQHIQAPLIGVEARIAAFVVEQAGQHGDGSVRARERIAQRLVCDKIFEHALAKLDIGALSRWPAEQLAQLHTIDRCGFSRQRKVECDRDQLIQEQTILERFWGEAGSGKRCAAERAIQRATGAASDERKRQRVHHRRFVDADRGLGMQQIGQRAALVGQEHQAALACCWAPGPRLLGGIGRRRLRGSSDTAPCQAKWACRATGKLHDSFITGSRPECKLGLFYRGSWRAGPKPAGCLSDPDAAASLAARPVTRRIRDRFGLYFLCIALIACVLGSAPASTRADGVMVMGDRELFRSGPPQRKYCEIDSQECDTVLTKFLSSYGYLRGALRGGLALTSPNDAAHLAGFGALHLDGGSAMMPGGDMAAGSVDLVLARQQLLRLRLTLVDLKSLFFCSDVQSNDIVLPFVGMVTKHCREDAVLGVDLRLLRLQWDAAGFMTEWLSAGPSVELLRNGHSQAHTRRSLVLALPIDLQSRMSGGAPHGTSLGAGLRASLLYRTPQWETRLRVRHRTALASGEGFAAVHSVDAELRLLLNWFAHESVVLQTGVALGADWASHDWAGQSLWSSRDARVGFQAGLYLGWINEAPAI